MKVKKTILSLFCFVLLFVLCACGSQDVHVSTKDSTLVQKEISGTAAPDKLADGTIVVGTVDELLNAIAPNTTILLEDNEYLLSSATNYGESGGKYYQWIETYDGYELQIADIDGLTLKGETGRTCLSTDPRYANVIYFTNCSNIRLESLVLGHTEKKGYCSGGVVYLNSCENISIESCKLFGCGTIGITASSSREIFAHNTDIYQCSYNAVYVTDCYDVRLDDCNIHDCGEQWSESVFTVNMSNGFAVVNSNIYANNCMNLLYSNYSQQVYIAGCVVEDNSFSQALFSCEQYSPVVEDCSIEYGQYAAFTMSWDGSEGMLPVSSSGETLSEEAVTNMKWRSSTYTGPQVFDPEIALDETFNEDGLREVRVKTTDEFLAAIGSNTVIYLESDHFDLSQAANYGMNGNGSYYWEMNYDGPGLVIKGVENLSIIGENTLIEAKPRYANVLGFSNCENLHLEGMTAGHIEEPGSCSGGVLYLEKCTEVTIENCSLYGCGIMGITAYCSEDLLVKNTEIYDCSYGAVELFEVKEAVFENCNIHDCGFPSISITDSRAIRYNGEPLSSGGGVYTVENGTLTEYRYG